MAKPDALQSTTDNAALVEETILSRQPREADQSIDESLRLSFEVTGQGFLPIEQEALQELSDFKRGIERIQQFDPTGTYLNIFETLKDPNSQVAQFMTQLGIRLEDPSITKLQEESNKLVGEITSYITELKRQRETIAKQSPFKTVLNLSMALAAAAPEQASQIVPMLMMLAPEIKQKKLRELDEEIVRTSASQADMANRVVQITSLAESRKLGIARFLGDTARFLTNLDFNKLRVGLDKLGQAFRHRLQLARQVQDREKRALELARLYIRYENALIRTMQSITPVTQQNLLARAEIMRRLVAMNESVRRDLQGTPYEALVQPYSPERIQSMIQSMQVQDYTVNDRIREMRARTQNLLAFANLANVRASIEPMMAALNINRAYSLPIAKSASERLNDMIIHDHYFQATLDDASERNKLFQLAELSASGFFETSIVVASGQEPAVSFSQKLQAFQGFVNSSLPFYGRYLTRVVEGRDSRGQPIAPTFDRFLAIVNRGDNRGKAALDALRRSAEFLAARAEQFYRADQRLRTVNTTENQMIQIAERIRSMQADELLRAVRQNDPQIRQYFNYLSAHAGAYEDALQSITALQQQLLQQQAPPSTQPPQRPPSGRGQQTAPPSMDIGP